MKEEMIPVLAKAVWWAEREAAKGPELSNWDQSSVYTATDCGSRYCIAGWIVSTHLGTEDPYVGMNKNHVGITGAMSYARDLLGLTRDEEEQLFSSDLSIGQIRANAETIAGRSL
jgi:hypothetical protein